MVGPNDDPKLYQDTVELRYDGYMITHLNRVGPTDVQVGDIVYFPTKNGSSYIFEISDNHNSYADGLLYRRGKSVTHKDSTETGDLDGVKAIVYLDYELLSVGNPAHIVQEDRPMLQTSPVVDGLQIIRFEQSK